MRAYSGTAQGGTFLEQNHKHVPSNCSRVAPVLSRIGDKWTILVVMLLGEARCASLSCAAASEAYLNGCLRSQCEGWNAMVSSHGLCFRPFRPAWINELTPLGHSLLTPIQQLGSWALQNISLVEDDVFK
jgi:hypothetical protein